MVTLKALLEAAALLKAAGINVEGMDDAAIRRGERENVKADAYRPTALESVDLPRRKRVNGGGPSKQYTIIALRKGSKQAAGERRAVVSQMFHTLRIVWDYILAHDPCTARDIENGTRLGKKTVESNVWKLRDMKLIKSEDLSK